jgi:uncharacterized protein YgiM (DUF1202 family)
MKTKQAWILALCAALIVAGLYSSRPVSAQTIDYGMNWTGFYWDNKDFTGNPKTSRLESAINFNYQTGSPDPAIPSDNFSARWSTTLFFLAGTYRFRAGADDGVRVAIDKNLILNKWSDATGGFTAIEADVVLGGGFHEIIVDYYEAVGNAGVQVYWTAISGGGLTSLGPGAATPVGATAVPSTPVAPTTGNLPASRIRAVIIVDLANVRSAPTTDAAPIAEVRKDEQFFVVANNGANTWFLIELKDGRRGWIFRRMIYLYNGDWTKLPVVNSPVQPVPPVGPVEGVARITTLVRNAPSIRNSDKIGTINEGSSFKVLKLSRNRAWVFVDADGLQGWVYLPNVKIVFGSLGRLPVGQ